MIGVAVLVGDQGNIFSCRAIGQLDMLDVPGLRGWPCSVLRSFVPQGGPSRSGFRMMLKSPYGPLLLGRQSGAVGAGESAGSARGDVPSQVKKHPAAPSPGTVGRKRTWSIPSSGHRHQLQGPGFQQTLRSSWPFLPEVGQGILTGQLELLKGRSAALRRPIPFPHPVDIFSGQGAAISAGGRCPRDEWRPAQPSLGNRSETSGSGPEPGAL